MSIAVTRTVQYTVQKCCWRYMAIVLTTSFVIVIIINYFIINDPTKHENGEKVSVSTYNIAELYVSVA